MLDRPIFLVGHARGGTTALGAIINWHSQVGPKDRLLLECKNVGEFLSRTLDPQWHIGYSSNLEQKDIWFDYFPGDDVFTHMGKELIIEKWTHDDEQVCQLTEQLTENFKEKRFLSKAPTNSFRVKAIKEIFPDAKFVAIFRRGEDVISSWGERSYGFGNRIDWGETKIDKLGYIRGISLFAKKWLQTLEYVEACKKDMDILTISYEDLATNTRETLDKLFSKLELPKEKYCDDLSIEYQKDKWKKRIPRVYHPVLKYMVRRGNKIIDNL